MRITVLEVLRGDGGAVGVRFRTSFGEATARWAGSRVEPRESSAYSAEFTVRTKLVWGKSARPGSAGRYSITQESDHIVLNGLVEDIDPDGVIYFRLSEDCLTMMESEGITGRGSWVQIRVPADCVEIYAQR